jgi:hypothetical protein
MSDVLNRYLEPSSALERANNIAQALVLGAEDPALIAMEMLDDMGIGNVNSVAAEVKKAWRAGICPVRGGKSASRLSIRVRRPRRVADSCGEKSPLV